MAWQKSVLLALTTLIIYSAYSQKRLALEVLINGKIYNERKTLDTDDIVHLKLIGTDSSFEYSFDKVTIELVTKRSLPDNYKGMRMQEQSERVKFGKKSADLSKIVPDYDAFSRAPEIAILFSQFNIACLSRVVLQVKKIKRRKNNKIEKIDTDEFDYQREISLYVRWDCKT